jgi:V-type H+-transporting ATPase subunit a
MARRLRFFSSQLSTYNTSHPNRPIPIRSLEDTPSIGITGTSSTAHILILNSKMISIGPRAQQMRDELDQTLTEHEKRLIGMNEAFSTLRERERELIEAREVLRSTRGFFERVRLFPLCQNVI